MTVADPNEFHFFRASEPCGALRGKVNEWDFQYYRAGEPMLALLGVLFRPRTTSGALA